MNKFINRKKNKRGFTLIELLVTVLILAILMAIALPLYLAAVADSELKTCRANMQTIANAVVAYRVRTRGTTWTETMSDLQPDLMATPVCPNAGTYTIDADGGSQTGNFIVECSYLSGSTGEHGSFEPGVDSQ